MRERRFLFWFWMFELALAIAAILCLLWLHSRPQAQAKVSHTSCTGLVIDTYREDMAPAELGLTREELVGALFSSVTMPNEYACDDVALFRVVVDGQTVLIIRPRLSTEVQTVPDVFLPRRGPNGA